MILLSMYLRKLYVFSLLHGKVHVYIFPFIENLQMSGSWWTLCLRTCGLTWPSTSTSTRWARSSCSRTVTKPSCLIWCWNWSPYSTYPGIMSAERSVDNENWWSKNGVNPYHHSYCTQGIICTHFQYGPLSSPIS